MQYVSILRHFPTRLAGLRQIFNTASQWDALGDLLSSVLRRQSRNWVLGTMKCANSEDGATTC